MAVGGRQFETLQISFCSFFAFLTIAGRLPRSRHSGVAVFAYSWTTRRGCSDVALNLEPKLHNHGEKGEHDR